jgi:prepilin-type N-terminal cleavage/methylation domain-containing protein
MIVTPNFDIRRRLSLKNGAGFTLIEILLVVALIALLAGIVIFAINIPKQLGDGRNARRMSDVNTILNAVHQYVLDNHGTFPNKIRQNNSCSGFPLNEICQSGAADCTNLTDMTVLTDNQKYLTAIPIDPSISTGNNTGYFIDISTNNRVTVCAPSAENGATISVTR